MTEHQWRCFHCAEVFTDVKLAAEHFGSRGDEKPAACGKMLEAFAEAFEQYGVHRNFHNAASVKILNNIWKDRLAAIEAKRDCGEVFTDAKRAAEHFGSPGDEKPESEEAAHVERAI